MVELLNAEGEGMGGAVLTAVEDEGGGWTSSSSESDEGKNRSGSDFGGGEGGLSFMTWNHWLPVQYQQRGR